MLDYNEVLYRIYELVYNSNLDNFHGLNVDQITLIYFLIFLSCK